LHGQKILNLKNIEKPLLLFASKGDNITPPQQALDWIIKEYSSLEEIKRLGKVIIYLLHPDIGHLGIFVGTKVARKEHNEIIKSIEVINALPPGLYEMIIIEKGKEGGVSNYDVRFEEREIKDLMALNDDAGEMLEEDADFSRVEAVSKINDLIYNTFFSPGVQMVSNVTTAEIIKQLNPLRVNKYIFSDRFNPFMLPFRYLTPLVQKDRKPTQSDNVFLELQNRVSDVVVAVLDGYQKIRDRLDETLFFNIYESPLMKFLLPGPLGKNPGSRESVQEKAEEVTLEAKLRQRWEDAMDKGGYEEGVIRIVMALENADHFIDRDALYQDELLLESSARFKDLTRDDFLHIVHDQSSILETDEDKAFRTLAIMIPGLEERRMALALARKIMTKESALSARQETVLSRMSKSLDL
jgi:hypothetical protein